jgi:hypothetical protein
MNTLLHTSARSIANLITVLGMALTVSCASSTPPPPTPTPPPPSATPEPKPSEVTLAQGKAAFIRIGCAACHKITGLSDQAVSAPALDDTYHMVLDTLKSKEYRTSGAKARTPHDFIVESIMYPDAFTYPKCPQGPCIKGTMPNNYQTIIHPDELEPLVTFLLWQGR